MAEPHKDRRAGLMAFGVLHILLGLFLFLLLLRITATAAYPDVAAQLFTYSAAVLYFIATGIGSVRARRWACALAAAVSAVWTAVGVFGLALLLIVWPHLAVIVRPSQEASLKNGLLAFFVFGMILLPLVLTLFYASRNTALTADELDPKIRWTDRVPVPVLALCVLLTMSSLTMLMNAGRPTFNFWGHVLGGSLGALVMIAFGILYAHLAIQTYRLRESAWWAVVLLHVITGSMWAVTLGRTEAVQQATTLTPQVRAMHLEQIFREPVTWVVMAIGWTAYLAFLIWLRRYFVGRSAEAPAPVVVST